MTCFSIESFELVWFTSVLKVLRGRCCALLSPHNHTSFGHPAVRFIFGVVGKEGWLGCRGGGELYPVAFGGLRR